jgi:ATP/maltotriose-dependent transcriptional regulator MalT
VSPFVVGRAREFALLDDVFAAAAAGEPGIVLVGGEAGVGKSRLVEEFAARAVDGPDAARVLSGSCVELGGEGLPFAPVVDALRQLVRTTPAAEVDALVGPARRDLARLLPELDPDVTGGDASEPGNASRLFEMLLGVVGRLAAQRPFVLVVEDLHWADRSTLDLLSFLVRAVRGDRVMLVGTYRDDELQRGHPLRLLVAELDRRRNVHRIELGRFDRDDVARQLEGITGSPPSPGVLDEVFERSEGNAFLVEEVASAFEAGGPGAVIARVGDVLLARVARLADPSQRLLEVVAVAGQRVSHPLLAAVSGLPHDVLDDALRETVDARVLVVDDSGEGYAFRHALAQGAVYAGVLPGERVRLHTAYADALEADPALAATMAAATSAIAHHRYAAHDLARALPAAVRAAREAASAYAYAEAARHLERALELWPVVPDAVERVALDHVDLLMFASDATTRAGDHNRALALIDEALREVDREREPARVALMLVRRGLVLKTLGENATATLEEAAALVPDPDAPQRAEVLEALAAVTLLAVHDWTDLRSKAEDAVESARRHHNRRAEAGALVTLGTTLVYLGDVDEGLAALRDARDVALEIDDDDTALRAYVNLSDALEAVGRHRDAADAAAEGIEFARRRGQYRTMGVFLVSNRAESLVRAGEWDDAEEMLREVAEIAPAGVQAMIVHCVSGEIAVARGDWDAAAHHASTGLSMVRQVDMDQFAPSLRWTDIARLHALGEFDAARAAIVEFVEQLPSAVERYSWPLFWIAWRIEADAAAPHAPGAPVAPASAEYLARLEAATPDAPALAPAPRGYQALARAERARMVGDPPSSMWADAVAAWREADEQFPLAYALYRLATARHADGERDAARAALEEAFGIATRLRTEPLQRDIVAFARRARLDLTAEGEAAAEPFDEASRLGLTSRELEVLALLAEGFSNSDIAAHLFMSPKTASVHVSRILAKLGVSTRGAAAAAAYRLGLVTATAES